MAFALNHRVVPSRDLAGFFDLAVSLGVEDVEIRNDLPGVAILDGTPAEEVCGAAAARGLSILSINALQRFNDWTEERAAEATALAAFARRCGAAALVLCPVNDAAFSPPAAERRAGLRRALDGLMPILAKAGVIGLVEPLGFAECSLRLKSEAVEAIEAVGGGAVFRLVHDSFHHHLAGEEAIFADVTGLVHISGVTDPSASAATMRDPHRVLVDAADRTGTVAQLERLAAAGYRGSISFEPFADEVSRRTEIERDLLASMEFIASRLRRLAAE